MFSESRFQNKFSTKREIEVVPHPNLNSNPVIDELGWDPASVQLVDLQQPFNANEILARVGGRKEFDPPNGAKFSLYDTSYVLNDSRNLRLLLRSTDYFTVMSVKDEVKSKPELRTEFGSLDPAKNLIPNSLCLHFIVRLENGNVLCMKRARSAAYHPSAWSFSGEEQLSDSDFIPQDKCLALFQRAFCEEVLGLREETPLSERWDIAAPLVKNMRLWSVFVEEPIFDFSLLGIYQLFVDEKELVAIYKRLVSTGRGSRDREGSLFVVSHDMIQQLYYKGTCVAKALFSKEEKTVTAEELHPTSRYRMFRLLRGLQRRPFLADEIL